VMREPVVGWAWSRRSKSRTTLRSRLDGTGEGLKVVPKISWMSRRMYRGTRVGGSGHQWSNVYTRDTVPLVLRECSS